ncbi:methylosome protein 50 [Plakobranchus ocellatus]|uniref:Methylosome protein 50 n=1 Tax=Plakobranchus ocellatus TaxID=259542 RepID=A0AAV4A743_9GAST|nr:methylosome protein 50 [Plakobranchus ocellatus]
MTEEFFSTRRFALTTFTRIDMMSNGGLLLGASCLTGQYWFGSLWFYKNPEHAPDVDSCTAGVQLEAGVGGARWVDTTHVLVGLDTGGIAVWRLEDDFHTFVLSQSASGHDGVVTSVSVTSDSHFAVTSAHDRCIKIWDLPSFSLVYSAKAHSDLVSCVDSHPSEPHLFLSCAQDDRILLWDRRKTRPASILTGSASKLITLNINLIYAKVCYCDVSHQDFVHGLAWPTYSKLYTCGWDAQVLSHNLDAGQPTVLGQASAASHTESAGDLDEREDGELGSPRLTNGDIADHVGGGDSGLKASYSQAVKSSSQEISAEG